MSVNLNEVDKIEILTLQDNYVDMVSVDSNEIVQRPIPIENMEIRTSTQAEHGFSSVVSVTREGRTRSMMFDFGFSENGAACNAETLGADLSQVEILALSHGHLDHTGGMNELVRRIGREKLQLILHPAAFKGPRYIKMPGGLKLFFPNFNRAVPEGLGLSVCETSEPCSLLDGDVVFMGEIPRKTEFEKCSPWPFSRRTAKKNGIPSRTTPPYWLM